MTNHYDTLGVPSTATPDEIKAAWRRATSAAHPDRAGGDTALQQAVNLAYEVLGDTEARARYDEQLHRQAATINAAATRILSDAFEAALRDGIHPVAYAHAEIENGRQHMAKTAAAAQRKRDFFARQRGLVRVRSGPNLVDQIIDRTIAQLEADSPALERALAVNARAAEMLALYVLPEQTLTQGQIQERRAKGEPLYG